MNRSFFLRIKSISIFAIALATASLAACGENLSSGNSCPLLCPPESAPLNDTIVDAVILDTSAVGFPTLGNESNLFLAHRRDSLDTRVITRFDSLPQTYKYVEVDSAIVRIDSAFILAPRPRADSAVAFGADGRLEVYDVTDAVNDTALADLAAQFTAGNLMGQMTYSAGESPDTLRVLLDTARVRSRVLGGRKLTIGLRMVSTGSDFVRVVSVNSGGGISLNMYPNRDTLAKVVVATPQTFSPDEPKYLRAALSDFVVAVAGLPPAANVLRVGGFPARRVLLGFDVPSRIIDSTVIIRATLLLTQAPSTAGDAGEAVAVQIVPILASSQLTDLHAQLEFAGSAVVFPVDSLPTVPKDSGVVNIEMVRLMRAWRGNPTDKTPRIAALYLSSEATRVASFDFFSREAAASLRPRLRITYVTRVNSGQP
jgi:hypothetical protein